MLDRQISAIRMADTPIVVPEFVLGELQALADWKAANAIVAAAASSHCKRAGAWEC